MEKLSLKVSPRTVVGRKVKFLRQKGVVPANVYGKGVESRSVEVNFSDFKKTFEQAGESTLVYLQIEGESAERPVLVRKVSFHPVSGMVLHVDFNQVNLKEKIKAPVSIELTGESEAVKSNLGILVQQMNEIEIEALPTDMPEHITVDITPLVEVDQAIYVKDIKLAQGLTTDEDPEQIVAKIEKLAAEEKVEAPVAAEGEATGEAATTEPAAENSDQPEKSSEPQS